MKVLALLCLVTTCFYLVSAQGDHVIDRNECLQLQGDHGVDVPCPTDYVAVGACSSGRDADCSGKYTTVNCCKLIPRLRTNDKEADCFPRDGGFGNDLVCQDNRVVKSVCSSGRDADCAPDVYNRVYCCDETRLAYGTNCAWKRGNFGALLDCEYNQVMRGFCGSGADADCADGTYSGVYCCDVL